jgi:uncharacterized protein (TIGR03118 family)
MMALSGLCLMASLSTSTHAGSYVQTNLVSDVSGFAPITDPNLKNPWGLAFSTTSEFRAADEKTGVSTLYTAPSGVPGTPVVTIAAPGGGTGSPTGAVNNSVNGVATTDFNLVPNSPATFIFASLNGTISGWNPGAGSQAILKVDNSAAGAVYTGLALANNGTQNQLYAADSQLAKISVFGPTFSGVVTSGFTDPTLPAGAAPFDIHLINGNLFVTYRSSSGFAAIDVFDTNGGFIRRFSTDSHLSEPWGLALAPSSFGPFGGDLLVGNKGNGQINAFNPTTGAFVGTLTSAAGQPIALPGLWEIAVRTGGGFDPSALYFATGLNSLGGDVFADGIFGSITFVPEPSSAILLGLGMTFLCGVCQWGARRRQRRGPCS